MGLRLVPFNAAWVQHHKIDVHAIYRRPRFRENEYGELVRDVDENGIPRWDLTGPLAVRSHNRWSAKGFEYVTLANRDSLRQAARFNTLPPGKTMRDYDQSQAGGPWNYRMYIEGLRETVDEDTRQLWADVDEFGSHAVETIRRRDDPAFTLPNNLANKEPGQLSKEAEAYAAIQEKAAKEHPSSPVGKTPAAAAGAKA